ncbi:MAG: hypothetical protein KAS32_24310 [Candidatus Peribacteraceae bacterium]|nr:hypothetical protein [Candidatus Peribacteraceae bacterium]
MLTIDQIQKDFRILLLMLLTDSTPASDLEKTFRGFAAKVIRYSVQETADAQATERAWTLLNTISIRYDAALGYLKAQEVVDSIQSLNAHTKANVPEALAEALNTLGDLHLRIEFLSENPFSVRPIIVDANGQKIYAFEIYYPKPGDMLDIPNLTVTFS